MRLEGLPTIELLKVFLKDPFMFFCKTKGDRPVAKFGLGVAFLPKPHGHKDYFTWPPGNLH